MIGRAKGDEESSPGSLWFEEDIVLQLAVEQITDLYVVLCDVVSIWASSMIIGIFLLWDIIRTFMLLPLATGIMPLIDRGISPAQSEVGRS